ncbi:ATP-dependent Clp protease proteolytic subunit [Luteolibacter sp. GHJ8]|uniref:ATP-dependent Clp protease proteolytic subunit n=1 Tax=Luteolibacter rhizosphaerae TaxID=2989719 RepID=A0ABT3G392_9BACT|nr:ATP-dependent Clp protease proteolytic subunit [Luteolibacter rhizosphaerae]MCW1914308.1 ATP-dependent Clp protease proteolytic subunit [Luteolibacter rhizosphaerae]
MKVTTRSTLALLAMATTLVAQEPAQAPAAVPAAPAPATATTPPIAIGDAPVVATPAVEKPAEKAPEAPKPDPIKAEQEKLTLENSLAAERLKAETNAIREEITRLKMEKELLAERISLAATKRQAAEEDANAKVEAESAKIMREASIAKAKAELLTNELKAVQSQSGIEISKLQNQIASYEMESKRKGYADAKPIYLENPLKDDGTLVISDRRIALNGLITMATADHITDRIDFFNNADRKLPIFIVIDQSPGGSVMAGYRILKAMESSDAPVHVVVKSFAASMAAGITTLAKESYAYPNAIILHHQISSTLFGQLNLTEQGEVVKESQRWWTRLATPVAQKMGVTTDEFIQRMYAHSTSGDWSEFGEDAQKLKWVNHIVQGIEESSFTKNPDAAPAPQPQVAAQLEEKVDANGKPFAFLPRLTPKDVYFLYNPDSYYRMR